MVNTSVWLSQIQFIVSVGFMGVFFLLELGLAWVLLFFKLANHTSRDNAWMLAYRFWVRVYALAAILALATSLPVLIQLGSLWPGLFERIGDVAGPLLAAAILTVFIVKSCFMSAMLFGQRSLSDRSHTVVVSMVAMGTTLAMFWVIALVAWTQTPAGTGYINGEYFVVDWYQLLASPSVLWIFLLVLAIAMILAGFMMLGSIARRASFMPADASGLHVFRTGAVISLAALLLYGASLSGYGLMVAQHQPAKAAATAAYWHSGEPAKIVFFGWPDEQKAQTRAELAWGQLADRWLGVDADGRKVGLDHFAGMLPPVSLVFWAWRLSIFIMVCLLFAALGAFRCLQRKHVEHGDLPVFWRWVLSASTYAGWVLALSILCHVVAGLFPFAVYDTIRLVEVANRTEPAHLMLGLAGHALVYLVLLLGFWRLLRHSVQYGVVPVARHRGRA